jgi:hypothetical protein
MVLRGLAVLVVVVMLAAPARAQVRCGADLPPVDHDADTGLTAGEFVHALSLQEGTFAKAFGNYGYTIDATAETLAGDTVDGRYHQISRLNFDANGPKRQPILATVNTLKRVKFSDLDVEALRSAFTLTPHWDSTGDVVYSGGQTIGRIKTALFDLLPRHPATDKRVHGFEGRAWVRAAGGAVMRLCGRSSATPIAPMRFEVIRALVDNQYWFPVSIRADEEVPAGEAGKVHVRINVTYSNYTSR